VELSRLPLPNVRRIQMAIEWESVDKEFTIIQARDTIEPEEVPKLIESCGRILLNIVFAYKSVMKRDPVGVSASVVNIYDELTRIKKILA